MSGGEKEPESFNDLIERDGVVREFVEDAITWGLEEDQGVLNGLSFVKYMEKDHPERIVRAIKMCRGDGVVVPIPEKCNDAIKVEMPHGLVDADRIRGALVDFVIGEREVRTLGVFDTHHYYDRRAAEELLTSLGIEEDRVGEVEIDNLGFVALCRSAYHVLSFVDFVGLLIEEGVVEKGDFVGIRGESISLIDVYKSRSKEGDSEIRDMSLKYREIGVE